MAFAALSVDLVAKMAKFEADMGKAARASEKTAQKVTRSLDVIKAGFQALAAAVSVKVLVGAFQAIVDGADELGKLSQRTGVAVETLGGLGYAALLAGGDVLTVTDAADKLNRTLAEAASGEKLASEAFKALGISATDAAGKTKSVDVAFAEIADKFAEFADGPEKVALAMRLFGKAGAEQIVLLNQGGAAIRAQSAEWQRYSGVTTQLTKDAEQFNDTFTRIGLIASGVGTRITASLLPSLQAVADQFLRLQQSGVSDEWAARVKFIFDKISLAAAALATQLTVVFKGWAALADVVQNPTSAKTIFSRLKTDIVAAYTELGRFADRLNGIGVSRPGDESAAERKRLGLDTSTTGKRSAPRLPSSASGGRSGATKQEKELDLTNKELARYVEGLEAAIQRTQDLSAEEEALAFLRKKGAGASLDESARIIGLARQVDLIKQMQAEEQALIDIDKTLGEQERARLQATEDRLKGLIDATPTARLEESRTDMLLLVDALERGAISQKVYLEAVSERLGLTNEKLEKTKSLAEDLGLTFTSAFEDAIVGGKKLSDVLKGLEQDILRIVTRKLVTEPLGKAITGMFSGGGSGGGVGGALSGLFGKIFGSFDGGGYTGSGPRSGGMDGKGGRLAMLHPRETVIDHASGQSAGRNVVVNIYQSFAPGTSSATTLQAAADARRQLEYAGRNL